MDTDCGFFSLNTTARAGNNGVNAVISGPGFGIGEPGGSGGDLCGVAEAGVTVGQPAWRQRNGVGTGSTVINGFVTAVAGDAGEAAVDVILELIHSGQAEAEAGLGVRDHRQALAAGMGGGASIRSLSSAQGKNIEDATGTAVMDRAELILVIFATRAR